VISGHHRTPATSTSGRSRPTDGRDPPVPALQKPRACRDEEPGASTHSGGCHAGAGSSGGGLVVLALGLVGAWRRRGVSRGTTA